MNAVVTGAALAAVALMTGVAAEADFNNAVNDYRAGHFDSAHAQFLQMAALGDCSSQFNLGAMALHGQGGPQDTGTGAGWLEAAVDNGCGPLVGGRLAALKPKLSDAEQRSAADILARYGHAALEAQGIINPPLECRDETAATAVEVPAADASTFAGADALVVAVLTVGTDGLARDPQILVAEPAGSAAQAAAVDAWLHGRFKPASRGGVPVASRGEVRYLFTQKPGASLGSTALLKDTSRAAEAGDPGAEYRLALASYATTTAGSADELLRAARDGNPHAQYWIGARLRATSACHRDVDGAVWLQYAAHGGDPAAQVTVARDLLHGAPDAVQLAEARTLLAGAASSSDFYVMKHLVALLAASPQDAVRDPATALAVARRLASGGIQSDPQMFEAVAAADAASGDYAGAAAQQQTAVAKAHALEWNTATMEQRLAAYRAGRPWHGDLFGP
jgi:TPR repeat protein